MEKQFERIELLFGEKTKEISKKSVLVLGVGGVGSYAVEALVRSGIENITIVDNDIIEITNLNRQLMTYHSNLGLKKVDALEARVKDINPKCSVVKISEFINLDNINKLFVRHYDYVIDACDTITVKLELIRICKRENIKLISSMGTGNKKDPSKLEIIDVRKTSYDPIAKVVRKMVKDEKIKGKVIVVASTEKPITKVNKVIPSNSYVPSVAGLLCASYVINDIVGD